MLVDLVLLIRDGVGFVFCVSLRGGLLQCLQFFTSFFSSLSVCVSASQLPSLGLASDYIATKMSVVVAFPPRIHYWRRQHWFSCAHEKRETTLLCDK